MRDRAEEYEIRNVNGRWGEETYPTEEAARAELKAFWKGVSGVDLRKFEIVPVDPLPSPKEAGR